MLEHDSSKYKFQFDLGGDNPEFSLVEEKQRKPLTLSQWLFAWNRFSALICIISPELGTPLPHHLNLILEMSRDRGSWQYYDIEYRKLIENINIFRLSFWLTGYSCKEFKYLIDGLNTDLMWGIRVLYPHSWLTIWFQQKKNLK